jgi:hypothetical protein
LRSLLAGLGEGLAGESSANKVRAGVGQVFSSDISYVSKYRNVGPVVFQYRLAVWLILDKTGSTKKAGGLKP